MMIVWKISLLITLALIQCTNTRQPEGGKDWVHHVIDDQIDAVSKAKRNIVSGVKSWVVVEPTERETQYVDEAMSYMFSVGTVNLLNTYEKLEKFCEQRNTYLVETAAWLIRKYTFQINIRVFMNIVLNNMRKKNDLYCADERLKQNYVDFSSKLTEVNPKLHVIRMNFLETLLSIQKSSVGVAQIPNFCCGYWRYRNDTIEAIDPNNPDLKAFVTDMIDSFFTESVNLVCLPSKENYSSLCPLYTGNHATGQVWQSILINMVEAISKITYILL